ncbi:polysaccharide deacetylase family protein [Halobacillus shinanisalinarum]|uniref:Polysaccharide deacetylase family protein n=1 Tax=Halobacillus shinanisalinarum TaxID=2932258 RepID=A0ABY4GYP3_9BACI|nr:polysaccharide deacetylase family protein [Halobacillus shinanisalinarum]UOQ93033.1 polysaccharide deacetylase family protein [Halobacillus shinanisalinarum]
MRKIFIMLLLALLLTACAGEQAAGKKENDQSKDSMDEQTSEEQVEEENKETEPKEAENQEDPNVKEDEAVVASAIEPEYELTDVWSFKPISDANEQVALLTFDDAPDDHALDIAKKLKELDAPAIFFVNGHFLNSPEEKEVLKQIHKLGFPIGNHTATHASLRDISKEQQREEIVGLNDKIEKIIGERPKFFRAPFGQNTDFSEQLAKEEGMLVMNWTYGYDWNAEYQNAEALADIMVNTELLAPGANLLMHDREWTAKAIPSIVKGLRDKGFELLDPSLIKTP